MFVYLPDYQKQLRDQFSSETIPTEMQSINNAILINKKAISFIK